MKTLDSLLEENARLEAAINVLAKRQAEIINERDRLRRALAFARSVIKSGEPWTATCEREIDGALEVF